MIKLVLGVLLSLLVIGCAPDQDERAIIRLPLCGRAGSAEPAAWQLVRMDMQGDTAFVILVCSDSGEVH